jgi:fyn-related kinase
VQLFAVCTIGEPIYIITELCKNGSMLDYLRSTMGESLRLPTLVGMATDVAAGMVRSGQWGLGWNHH